MQKSQPRILCSVLWLAIVAIIVIAMLVPTYRLNETFVGEAVTDGERYPATVTLDFTYRRDPFFGDSTKGILDLKSELENYHVQRYDYVSFDPGFLDHVLYNPRFCDISATGWYDQILGLADLRGHMDIDNAEMLLLYGYNFSFAGRACSEERAAEIFNYLDSWLYLKDYYTENPFSHTPFVDHDLAVATRTETPPDVLLKMAVRDLLSDCWEYLLIGAVALVALILSHWFPQIYLSKWILDELQNGSVGAKKYLNHSRICFTAMGLVVPLFACLAHFFDFYVLRYWLTSGVVFFVAMIAAIIALLVLLHRRAWIQIKEK